MPEEFLKSIAISFPQLLKALSNQKEQVFEYLLSKSNWADLETDSFDLFKTHDYHRKLIWVYFDLDYAKDLMYYFRLTVIAIRIALKNHHLKN